MSITQAVFDSLAEAVWPTRCVVCDAPGHVLCPTCAQQLPFIDQWNACPVCGAPYGRYQCTECNSYRLREVNLRKPPFKQCVSAVIFDDRVARIVRGRKDAHERRLDEHVAFYIASAIPPGWIHASAAICPIPASRTALRLRGFDHGSELAHQCASLLGLPVNPLLYMSARRDQRDLGRAERFANMSQAFSVTPQKRCPTHVVLIDDVYTTGATLVAAALALKQAGVRCVYAATFAHVYQN